MWVFHIYYVFFLLMSKGEKEFKNYHQRGELIVRGSKYIFILCIYIVVIVKKGENVETPYLWYFVISIFWLYQLYNSLLYTNLFLQESIKTGFKWASTLKYVSSLCLEVIICWNLSSMIYIALSSLMLHSDVWMPHFRRLNLKVWILYTTIFRHLKVQFQTSEYD